MNTCIVFGGKSVEHDVSIVTAKQIYNIKPDCILVYITKDGQLSLYKNSKFEFKDFKGKPNITPIILKDSYIYVKKGRVYKKFKHVDCAIMCTHGGDGENGKIVSVFNQAQIPTTAGSVVSLGISMDKWLTKLCLSGLNLPIVNGFVAHSHDDVQDIDKKILSTINYPVILKPCGGGSSIGVQVVKTKDELKEKLSIAFEFDDSIVIEKELVDFIEYNCGVMGDRFNCRVSKIDQPLKKDEILSFKDKYLSGSNAKGKASGMKGQLRTFPAKVDKKIEKQIQEYSKQIFTELGFFGVVRIDYMYDNTSKKLYVNEINAIPGSLGFYFFTNSVYNGSDFVNELISIAVHNYNNYTNINKNYITKLF